MKPSTDQYDGGYSIIQQGYGPFVRKKKKDFR